MVTGTDCCATGDIRVCSLSDTRGTALRPDPWPFSKECCTRLRKRRDSVSSVMLATPGPCTHQRFPSSDGMDVCSSTPLLSRSSAFPIHWQTVSVCVENKTTNSAECFCRKELDFGIEVVVDRSLLTEIRQTQLGIGCARVKVATNDVHRHPRWSGILLQTSTAARVLSDIHELGHEVERHVSHQWCLAYIRHVVELHTVHHVVRTIVHVCGFRIQGPLRG